MYYGFAESVIIAGPRNAHRRPLIPPLAILFSSLLSRAPSARPVRADPRGYHFLEALFRPLVASFFSSLSSLSPFSSSPAPCHVTPVCPLYNHYRLSRGPGRPVAHPPSLPRFPSFVYLSSSLRSFVRALLSNSIMPHYELTERRGMRARAFASPPSPLLVPALLQEICGNLSPRRTLMSRRLANLAGHRGVTFFFFFSPLNVSRAR